MGWGFGTLVGPVGVGVVSLSSFTREVKRLEVTVGGDKWRLSLACLATRSEDSCVGLPRLWECGPGGTGWRLGKGTWWGAEQGDYQLEVGRRAPGWDSLSREGHTRRTTHCCKSTQSLKKHRIGIWCFVVVVFSLQNTVAHSKKHLVSR
jgi:hypothetical protein